MRPSPFPNRKFRRTFVSLHRQRLLRHFPSHLISAAKKQQLFDLFPTRW